MRKLSQGPKKDADRAARPQERCLRSRKVQRKMLKEPQGPKKDVDRAARPKKDADKDAMPEVFS